MEVQPHADTHRPAHTHITELSLFNLTVHFFKITDRHTQSNFAHTHTHYLTLVLTYTPQAITSLEKRSRSQGRAQRRRRQISAELKEQSGRRREKERERGKIGKQFRVEQACKNRPNTSLEGRRCGTF